jgi:hypothetical protein
MSMSSVTISGRNLPADSTALRRSAVQTPENVMTRPQVTWARRSTDTVAENSIACIFASSVVVLTTRGLPVTAATRGTLTKCGTIQRSTSRLGRPSASTISTISPRASGHASLSAIALPSLTCFVTRRMRPCEA